jgi:hypothetical protein
MSVTGTAKYTNPTPATEVLRRSLVALNYSPFAASSAANIVSVTGSVADAVECGWIEAYDEAFATDVHVNSLPEVPFDDPAWGDDSTPDDDFDDVGPDDLAAADEGLRELEGDDSPTGEWPSPARPSNGKVMATMATLALALTVGGEACRGLATQEPRPTAVEAAYEPTASDIDWWAAQCEARDSWLQRVAEYLDARELRETWAVD